MINLVALGANQQGTVTGPDVDHIGVLCILRGLPRDAEQCEAVNTPDEGGDCTPWVHGNRKLGAAESPNSDKTKKAGNWLLRGSKISTPTYTQKRANFVQTAPHPCYIVQVCVFIGG